MIGLKATTESIYITSNATATTDEMEYVTVSRERTSTTFLALNKFGTTAGTTPETIVDSPSAASTQVLVDYISIYNKDTVSHTVTVALFDSTNAFLLFKCLLLTLEKLEFVEGQGWSIYNADGTLKTTQSAAGSTTQIQYNSAGSLAGDPDFTFDSSTDTFGLTGSNANILLTDRTTDPSAPASGKIVIWAKKISGRSMLKQMGEGGIDTPFQNAFFQNNIVQWRPTTAAAGVYEGTIGANLGTPAAVLPTVTNLATMMRRSTFPSVVTTANQQVGIRTEAMFFRGNASNLGGFFYVCRFMFATWTAGNRLFVGLCSGTTAVVTVQPSTLLNMLGFGVDAGDTAITFMHNDGTGTCTKDPISGQPALATNQGYIAYVFAKPNDTTVYYRLDDVNLQTTIIDTSTSSDLPVNTTGLTAQCIMGNAANVVAGNATIGVNCMYIETDI